MPVLSKYVRKLCGSDHSFFLQQKAGRGSAGLPGVVLLESLEEKRLSWEMESLVPQGYGTELLSHLSEKGPARQRIREYNLCKAYQENSTSRHLQGCRKRKLTLVPPSGSLSIPALAINPEQNEACLQPLIDLTPLPPAPHLQLGKSDPTELGRTLWGLIPISGPLLSLVNHYTSNATTLSCTNLHSYALGGWNPWNGMLPC